MVAPPPDLSGPRVPVIGCVGEGLAELTVEAGGPQVRLAFGGDMANVAVMAGRAGGRAPPLGRVGADPLGECLLRFWRDEGIDADHVTVDPRGATGLYLNQPGPEGHGFVYWRAGSAGSRLDKTNVPRELIEDLD